MGAGFQAQASCFLESQDISLEAVKEDQAEEVESYEAALDIEAHEVTNGHYLQRPIKSEKRRKIEPAELTANLRKASEHVIVENTQNEYRR